MNEYSTKAFQALCDNPDPQVLQARGDALAAAINALAHTNYIAMVINDYRRGELGWVLLDPEAAKSKSTFQPLHITVPLYPTPLGPTLLTADEFAAQLEVAIHEDSQIYWYDDPATLQVGFVARTGQVCAAYQCQVFDDFAKVHEIIQEMLKDRTKYTAPATTPTIPA